MGNNLRLSFIIPCHNSHLYLRECMDSLYNQDISETEYEIIAINDYSTDNTKEILTEYHSNHNNLTIINLDKNKGQGEARNIGLSYAKGELIWYVDHDDFLKPKILSYLLTLAESNNLDFLQFNYSHVNTESKFLKEVKTNEIETGVLSGIDYARNQGSNFMSGYNMSVWSRIYRRMFLTEGNFHFEEIRIFEDLGFSLETLLLADRIRMINCAPYCYRINPQSLMRIFGRSIRGDFIYFSCIRSGLHIYRMGGKIDLKDPFIAQNLRFAGTWRINKITKPIIYAKPKEIKRIFSLINKDKDIIEVAGLLTPVNSFIYRNQKLFLTFITIFFIPINSIRFIRSGFLKTADKQVV